MTTTPPSPSTSEEATLIELQSRLRDIELNKTHNDVTDAIRNERTEMLLALRNILAAMKSEAASGSGENGSGGVVATNNKELERLRAENEELKKVNAKQAYRIEHLVWNLRMEMEKNQGKQ